MPEQRGLPPESIEAQEQVHPILEVAVVALLWASAVVATAGAIAPSVVPDRFASAARLAEPIALLAAVCAVGLSIRLSTLRRMRAQTTGGRAYDRERGERGLRVAAGLVQLLEFVAAILVVVRVADVIDLIDLEIKPNVVDGAVRVLAAALALACAGALGRSLRVPNERHRSALATALAILALLTATGMAAFAAAGALGRTGRIAIDPADTSLLALAGFAALAVALVQVRSLPTLTWLLQEDRADAMTGHVERRGAAVLIPAILAFALLLVVFLLFLLFGIGVGDLVLEAGRSPLLIGVLGFLFVAITASLLIALRLARSSKDAQPLYKELPDAEKKRTQRILAVSALASAIFLSFALLSFNGTINDALWLHLLCFALLVAIGPYGFYAAREHRRIRRLEERFPDFLRDIASSHKGGLTLHQAASVAAKGEYGDLTPEVRKMADQLSWNVSFSEALQRFSERVQTPLVQRAVSLILQADRSGGSTTDVLLAAARDAREIKNLENERRTTMGLYTVVVYITFAVFLAVAAILYSQFAPQIVASSQAVQSLSGPGTKSIGGETLSLAQYRLFYFVAAVMQGLGDGVVAGLLGNGRAVLGLRHAFMMVLASYLTFMALG